MRIQFILLLVLFSTLSGFAADENSEIKIPNTYAVIIGINNYKECPLFYARADAQDLFDTLTNKECGSLSKDNVKLFLDTDECTNKPEKDKILNAVKEQCDKVKEGERLIFFFSGHGFIRDGKSYLIPKDYNCKECGRLDIEKCIPVDDITKSLSESQASEVLLFVDACRSIDNSKGQDEKAKEFREALSDSQSGDIAKSFEVKQKTGVTRKVFYFFACDTREKAFEPGPLKHGVFSNFIIKGLQGYATESGKKGVTSSQLHTYVCDSAKEYGNDNPSCKQTPYIQMEGTDIFLSRAKGLKNPPKTDPPKEAAKDKPEKPSKPAVVNNTNVNNTINVTNVIVPPPIEEHTTVVVSNPPPTTTSKKDIQPKPDTQHPGRTISGELPTITVLRFDGGGLELSRILTDTLSDELSYSKRFKVIEYEDIPEGISDSAFEKMGAVSSKEATKIGKMIGCQLVATGTVINHEGPKRISDDILGGIGEKNAVEVTMTVNFKIIDAETGEIWIQKQTTGKASDKLSSDIDVDSLWRKAAINAVKDLAWGAGRISNVGCVIEVEKDGICINLGSKNGVNKDTEFLISRLGKDIIDPTTGEVIGSRSEIICRAHVISGSIQPQLCQIEPGYWKQRIIGFSKVWRWCKFDAKDMPEVKVNDKVEIVKPEHQ